MSGLMQVEDPIEDHNILVQDFKSIQYYEQASEFDVLCGTSRVAKYDKQRYVSLANIK